MPKHVDYSKFHEKLIKRRAVSFLEGLNLRELRVARRDLVNCKALVVRHTTIGRLINGVISHNLTDSAERRIQPDSRNTFIERCRKVLLPIIDQEIEKPIEISSESSLDLSSNPQISSENSITVGPGEKALEETEKRLSEVSISEIADVPDEDSGSAEANARYLDKINETRRSISFVPNIPDLFKRAMFSEFLGIPNRNILQEALDEHPGKRNSDYA